MNFWLNFMKMFMNWLGKVLKKWLWILGFLPMVLDYIATYIPDEYVPGYIQRIIDKGVGWQFTLVLVCLGLLISAFLVHLETQRALEECEQTRRENKSKQPCIIVGFLNEDKQLTKELQIRLKPLPPQPDFDVIVAKKREELLLKKPRESIQTIALFLNPNYEQEVDEYLKKYRIYLVKRYEREVAKDRVRYIALAVENRGYSPANDISFELEMPRSYKRPAEHQIHNPPPDEETLEQLGMSREEWEEWKCGLPTEPQLVRDPFRTDWVRLPFPRSDSSFQNMNEHNNGGPAYEVRQGKDYIVYTIKRLIQHRLVDDLEPFPVWLGDVEDQAVWEIPVRITCADIPEPQWETLRLDIRVVSQNAPDLQL